MIAGQQGATLELVAETFRTPVVVVDLVMAQMYAYNQLITLVSLGANRGATRQCLTKDLGLKTETNKTAKAMPSTISQYTSPQDAHAEASLLPMLLLLCRTVGSHSHLAGRDFEHPVDTCHPGHSSAASSSKPRLA